MILWLVAKPVFHSGRSFYSPAVGQMCSYRGQGGGGISIRQGDIDHYIIFLFCNQIVEFTYL
jgi:hypothetical protein